MALLLAGAQKYFSALLVALLILAGSTALVYRANYQSEQIRRVAVEGQLQETLTSLDTLKATHAAQMAAILRNEANDQTREQAHSAARERTLNAADDQNGPVSDILRDAINGMR
jgi:hypothetical protein